MDAETIQTIEQYGAEKSLAEIQAELWEGRYRPSPVKRRYIPKADGKHRSELFYVSGDSKLMDAELKLAEGKVLRFLQPESRS